ncbi:hypothetical protein GCM10010407_00190 [Rarobacter incanus]
MDGDPVSVSCDVTRKVAPHDRKTGHTDLCQFSHSVYFPSLIVQIPPAKGAGRSATAETPPQA